MPGRPISRVHQCRPSVTRYLWASSTFLCFRAVLLFSSSMNHAAMTTSPRYLIYMLHKSLYLSHSLTCTTCDLIPSWQAFPTFPLSSSFHFTPHAACTFSSGGARSASMHDEGSYAHVRFNGTGCFTLFYYLFL
ncbi:hypothetical protein SCLCIDRAFT_993183 [Scleroderma citrinum Foug A]|uniref:Uncharacterized protein n=1 Tax=Scleroderma citrinum Foug A TaxID=1036808 RepID=A0A0C2ZCG7_9AGAM|nr:hypothetical protein SCLCIDRAFT_993183 [Scleroderma citrinum Foug A]